MTIKLTTESTHSLDLRTSWGREFIEHTRLEYFMNSLKEGEDIGELDSFGLRSQNFKSVEIIS